MNEWLIALGSAFGLGILTSISPCPMATNIAAISYVGRRVDKPSSVLVAGLLYTLGRMLAYMVLAVVLVTGMLKTPVLSQFLQKYMNLLLGPILIIVGMLLLEMISINPRGGGVSESLQKRTDALGSWGGGLLGIVFALSFCPTSAALFFGSLLPLAVKMHSGVVLPLVYGLATGLPVLFFAGLLAFGANRLATAYNRLTIFDKWMRRVIGALFIALGIYYSLTYIFGI
jgi:cytochrome c biogenesis protein CcdA